MAIDRKACFQRQLLDISNATDDLDERVTALEQGGGGGGDVPENMVTTNTDQTISGEKTFTSNIKLGTGIDIDGGQSNTLYVGSIYENGTDISDKYATITDTEEALSEKLDIYKHFDDDDNPEDFYIKQPETYSSGIELHASRDDNHHPDYTNLLMTPTHVVMMTNSANHGDNDDDYTGSIEVTDDYVDLEVTDGTNTTTLRVAPSGVTVNGSPIGGGGSTLYRHKIKIIKKDSSDNIIGFIAFAILNKTATQFTTLASIAGQMVYEPASGYWQDGSNYRDVIALEGQLDPSIMQIRLNYPAQPNAYSLLMLRSNESGVTVSDEIVTL